MNILTSVDPGSVSHVGVSELPHLHSDGSTRTSSSIESKTDLNKLLRLHSILAANKLARKHCFYCLNTYQLASVTAHAQN